MSLDNSNVIHFSEVGQVHPSGFLNEGRAAGRELVDALQEVLAKGN